MWRDHANAKRLHIKGSEKLREQLTAFGWLSSRQARHHAAALWAPQCLGLRWLEYCYGGLSASSPDGSVIEDF